TDDFGIKSLSLSVNQGQERIKYDALPDFKEPMRTLHASFSLDLAALNVKPGSKLQYWVTVRDNKEPQANKFETPKYEIEVVDPASKEELAKQTEEAKRDRDDTKKAQEAAAGADPNKTELADNRPQGDPDQGKENPGGPGKPGEGGPGAEK